MAPAKSKGLLFFRALLPNWSFFDRTGEVFLLFGRFRSGPGAEWSEWSDVLPPRPRGFLELFLNPHGSERLAAWSVVEALVDSLEEDPSRIESRVEMRLLRRLVRRRFEDIVSSGSASFQFKLASAQQDFLRSAPFAGQDP